MCIKIENMIWIALIIVIMYVCWSSEKFLPYPYMLSNGLFANTDLEAVVDADWNGMNKTYPPSCPSRRPDTLTKIVDGKATTFETTALLYEAMGIPNVLPIATPTCLFINDVGYMYKK